MNLVVLGVGLSIFAAFAWAVRYHFRTETKPLGFIAVTLGALVNIGFFADVIWRKPQSDVRLGAALALMLAGAAIFIWAIRASRSASLNIIFDGRQPGDLLQRGPYRWIRHPFYASYILYYAGVAVATLHAVNIGYVVLLAPVLAAGAIAEERAFQRSPQADAYRAYRKRAGLFWPKLG